MNPEKLIGSFIFIRVVIKNSPEFKYFGGNEDGDIKRGLINYREGKSDRWGPVMRLVPDR